MPTRDSSSMARAHPDASFSPTGRWKIPSWGGSVALHALLLGVVLVLMQWLPARITSPGERTAENVGIVLKKSDEHGKTIFDSPNRQTGEPSPNRKTDTPLPSVDEILDQNRAHLDLQQVLPSKTPRIGPSALEGGGVPAAPEATSGAEGSGTEIGGKARVRFMGTEGTGNSFVFVLDRSASMGGVGTSPLRYAKSELAKSLESLESTHQFEIVFFNERPSVLNTGGLPGRLPFATEKNKRRTLRSLGGIIADGGTDHEEALLRGIQQGPDVIFFLTDAGEPEMSAAQLYRIRRKAAGIQINVIEFGTGSEPSENFLKKLARQNGGQYSYVNIGSLR